MQGPDGRGPLARNVSLRNSRTLARPAAFSAFRVHPFQPGSQLPVARATPLLPASTRSQWLRAGPSHGWRHANCSGPVRPVHSRASSILRVAGVPSLLLPSSRRDHTVTVCARGAARRRLKTARMPGPYILSDPGHAEIEYYPACLNSIHFGNL